MPTICWCAFLFISGFKNLPSHFAMSMWKLLILSRSAPLSIVSLVWFLCWTSIWFVWLFLDVDVSPHYWCTMVLFSLFYSLFVPKVYSIWVPRRMAFSSTIPLPVPAVPSSVFCTLAESFFLFQALILFIFFLPSFSVLFLLFSWFFNSYCILVFLYCHCLS